MSIPERLPPLTRKELKMENEDPEVLLQSALRFFKFLPGHERQKFVHRVTEKAS